MRIENTSKQTPQSAPASSSPDRRATEEERFVWEVLASRLLDPSKLAFIRALLEHGKPLSLRELAGAGETSENRARYHCKAMQKAGVLEIVSTATRAAGEGDEPSYFFSGLPQAPAPRPAEAPTSPDAST
jgi:predicted transcriptional regulator